MAARDPPASHANADMDNNQQQQSSSGSEYSDDDDYAWIPWYCTLKGNELFCEVDADFAQDSFNLTGLQNLIPYFDYALDMILDVEPSEALSEDQQEMIENDAENLFGLIHARYILTTRGLQAMLEKYRLFHFGRCPRVYCRGQACLPLGLSDVPNEEAVKLWCPRCEDVYSTRSARHEQIDGAYFGTTFPHLFFLTFPELKPQKSVEAFVPRVFGFKIHQTAYKASLDAKKKVQETQQAAAAAAQAAGNATAATTTSAQAAANQEADKLKAKR